MPRRNAQLTLPRTSGWGGARKGAGRKPKGEWAGVPHVARPAHQARHPVHATFKALPRVGSLREVQVYNAIEEAIARASRPECRIVHFSVQGDHLHCIIEASDRAALLRGLRGLAIRLARAINGALGQQGRVWADRYHARALKTPSEVRRALVYVLQNWRKAVRGAQYLDGCSSARFFDGWRGPRPPWSLPGPGERAPVWAARTWLLTTGWRRLGLIGFDEAPRGAVGW
jgi:REP element-mobilizing transposase RayT